MSEHLALASDVRFRVVGDETIVVQQGANRVLVMNAMAGEILSLLADGVDKSLLLQQLYERFEADSARLQQDVEGFVDSLKADGLLAV